jgi:Reverse transcriptase (RNA-dependent DNA polymerase)
LSFGPQRVTSADLLTNSSRPAFIRVASIAAIAVGASATTRRHGPGFVNRGLSLLDGHRHSAMYRTDVEAYYPSVDVERLQSLLQECECLVPAAALILKVLQKWQLRDGLRGMPIGPEVSAVIGNFLLHPVDTSLEANGYAHLRWSDDILLFGRTAERCQGSMVLLDEVLSDLRLARSVKKTRGF